MGTTVFRNGTLGNLEEGVKGAPVKADLVLTEKFADERRTHPILTRRVGNYRFSSDLYGSLIASAVQVVHRAGHQAQPAEEGRHGIREGLRRGRSRRAGHFPSGDERTSRRGRACGRGGG